MEQRSCSQEASEVLLEQFELMLVHHKIIDEVGFIHPSQFAELNEDSSFSWSPPSKVWQILDESRERDTTGSMYLQNKKTVFWYGNHKLAISMQVVPLLYNAARRAHMDARINYKRSINIPKSEISLNTATYVAQFPETEILKHSRALLILSPDSGSVWNSRLLHLCSLILVLKRLFMLLELMALLTLAFRMILTLCYRIGCPEFHFAVAAVIVFSLGILLLMYRTIDHDNMIVE